MSLKKTLITHFVMHQKFLHASKEMLGELAYQIQNFTKTFYFRETE